MKLQKIQSNPAINFRATMEENIVASLGDAINSTAKIAHNNGFIWDAQMANQNGKLVDEATLRVHQNASLINTAYRDGVLTSATRDKDALTSLVQNWQSFLGTQFKIEGDTVNLARIMRTSFMHIASNVNQLSYDGFISALIQSARKNGTENVIGALAEKLAQLFVKTR